MLSKLTGPVIALARAAGEQVLEVYGGAFSVEYKSADHSPLTDADKRSHRLIQGRLKEIADLPVLSEEAALAPWRERQRWERYWLVDPLDGTKEFVSRNGQFTVNIALIDKGRAVLGVVYAPALRVLYYGAENLGAYKITAGDHQPSPIQVAEPPATHRGWKIMGSRSHQSPEFRSFVGTFDQPDIMFWGSSLKLCLIAEGEADLYPRFGPTCEWDTAAGQAVLEAAGGRVIDWGSKTNLRYNSKESVLNPSFVACAERSSVWL